ncbi:MAG: autotransporter-associated beta strand repeat-containing protein [Kiritimatiellae bacterium]|nr:autotransporter-associated beta strand repeat-containing protein [Kiritimatiellia bacterium]
MTTRKLKIVLAVCVAAFCVRAENRTWTGGGGDANWSTPANWGGTAPTTNDTLFFSGTTRLASTNDLPEDIPLAGIIFNSGAGAFTLGGNRLTLNGNVSNLSASAQTLALPALLPETRVFFSSSNGAVTVSGSLSGAGGLTKAGFQTLTLAASNSYDGVTTVNDGLLSVTHGNALGSVSGNTEVNGASGGCLEISGSINVPEALSLNKQRPGGKNILYIPGGSNTLSGLITCDATRIHSAAGTTLVFAGGLTNKAGYIVLSNPSGSTVAFYNTPISSRGNRFYLEGTGLTILGVAGNIWTPTEIASIATLRTDVADAIPPAAPLRMNVDNGTLNLNGFDQTVSELFHLSKGTLYSPVPATLTVNQNSSTLFYGKLTGALNLFKTGTGTLILSNSLSTTTGNITVTNGTLVAALDNSLGNSTNITVLGGTLDLRAPNSIADEANLSISNGATVTVGNGISERVGQLFLDGVQQMSGTWGSTASGASHADDTHFSGTGTIYVLNSPPISATDATWDGEGTDTLLNTATNWLGDTAPALDGTARALFGTGGDTATVNTAAKLYGITFNRADNFTLADGDGTLELGAGGITAASPDTASRTYTVAEDITLTENSTWHVATNEAGVSTLTVSGAIHDGTDSYAFTKTGFGALTLSGNSTYDGVTAVNAGALYLTHPNALGSTNGMTEVDCMAGAHLNLRGGINVAEPFLVNGQRPLSKYSIYSDSGSNTLSGPIMRKPGGVGFRIHLASGTALIIRGGITGTGGGGWHIFNNTGGFLALYDKPMVIVSSDVVFFEALGNMSILGVSGNVWGQTRINAAGTLRTDVPNALPESSTLVIENANTLLNLNGCGQSISGIVEPCTGTITSAVPATLTVNQKTAATLSARLTGAVGLLKAGTATLTLSNALSTTTGDITVTNGTLAVALDNSLGNSTNITVSGSAARLELRTSSGISDTAALKIANDGAKVNLLTGVNETVGWLYTGEKMRRSGTYGSTSSSAANKDDAYFEGTGILTVLHDHCGTIVSLR